MIQFTVTWKENDSKYTSEQNLFGEYFSPQEIWRMQ